MVKKSKSKKKDIPLLKSEKQVDDWLQDADLTDYFEDDDFQAFSFENLEQKLLDEAYSKSLKSQPVTLRLSKSLIQKLKLLAIRKGIAYQTLAKMLLQEQVDSQLLKNHQDQA